MPQRTDISPFFAAVLAWLVFAVCALWLSHGSAALDTDSAMRLAQVRDLLHGQAWFDTVQHRMNTPYGLPMHWSRLVDGPLALLMLVSERFALTAWPLLLLLGVMFVLARLALALGGRAAVPVVLLLTLLCTEIFGLFSPGDIDHHGLQALLMLSALLGVVERRPCLTAIALALGLGVGLESLPYALLAIAAGSLWLWRAPDKARVFGVTLCAVAAALLLATTALAYRTAPVCDTYSLFYAVLLMVGGAGVAAISYLARYRLVAFLILAALLLGLAAALNPACFAGPYGGMDARLQTLFLARINEARPVWRFAQLALSQVVGGYGYAAFALLLCLFAPAARGRNWVIAFGALALGVATFQIRAVPFAILFALPGLAAALVHITRKHSIVWLAAAILLGNSGAFTLAGVLLEGQDRVARAVTAFHAQEDCGSADAMALLRALPRGRVAGFVDQGPAIMAYTNDAAIAGPYHRDAAGILDSYAIFTGPQPQAILNRRGIDYVMTCRAAPDWDFYRAQDQKKTGLIAQLAAGHLPPWLTRAGTRGDVTVYRVIR